VQYTAATLHPPGKTSPSALRALAIAAVLVAAVRSVGFVFRLGRNGADLPWLAFTSA
jgi:hypothetical protein